MVTEQQAEAAIEKLKMMIEAAENSNQAGEDAVVAAAAGPMMLAALKRAQSFIADMAAGEPPALLTPDGVEPNEFASSYEETASAIREAIWRGEGRSIPA